MKKTQTMVSVILIVLNIIGAASLAMGEHDSAKISSLLFENISNNGDITWTKHMIEEDISHASGIHGCDIDNDGDGDVVACGAHDNEVAFWRNDGGDPIEWTKYSIDDEFEYPMDVFSCDIDDDGDIDVLGAAWAKSEIALWKNAGGNPIKWSKQTIKNNYPGAHEVFACDFDDDGDYDVFGASAGLNRIDWWRNDGGIPIQWTEQTIGQQFGGARSVFSRDLDDDGDNDVVGAALTDNTISWWCNEGGDPIEWTEYEITSEFEGAHHVYADDVDKDGDIDVLGAGYFQNQFAWWQNEGGEPITWKKQVIDTSSPGAMRVCVEDIDNDGDRDIIGSSSQGNSISWWSNDGGDPIHWTKHTIDNQCPKAWPIYPVDMDKDGDMDMLGGSESSGGIMWYENSLYPIGSDLECQGSLRWTNVKPESTITGSFSIKNVGDPSSFLDWDIDEYPAWGTWTFQPENGEDLRPEDGEIEVEVTIKVPHSSNEEFTGEIKIINVDNRSDYSIIDVSLVTPKNYLSSSSGEGKEYWALLVGCNEFLNRPDLDLPGNDLSAEDFRELLLLSDCWQPDHIKVLTGKDATSMNILKGLRWLDTMDDEDDVCLFYIATHAGPLGLDFPPFDEEDGDELLTTYSTHRFYNPTTRVSIVIPWISYLYDDEINLFLSMLDAQGICAIFNTCYAGGFDDPPKGEYFNFLSKATFEKSTSEWMAEFAEDISASGRIVLMACKEDDISLGSVFSYYLMEGLQGFGDLNDDSTCSAEESFEYALPKTKGYLGREFSFTQVPQMYDDYSGDLILTDVEMPPSNPEITGPTLAYSNSEHTYSVSSSDPEGDAIRYYINWGDDTEGWSDFYPTGEEVILTHSWDSIGTYNIWFENEDEHGASKWESSCLDRFVVTIADECMVDQQQTETYEGQCYNDAPLTNSVWLAQSFIPNFPLLSKVELEAIISLVYSEDPGPLHVSIRSNLTGDDLTSAFTMPMQIDSHMVPFIAKFKWTMFDFPDIKVTPGEKYYIICRFENDSIGAWTYAGVGYDHDLDYDGDPYLNGEAYYSLNKGNTWEEFLKIHDFCFVTYGGL